MAAKSAKQSRKSAQSKPESKPSGRGGRRAGAGRKTAEQIKARQDLNSAVDGVIGEMALDLVANLKRLADGGYKRVTVTEEPAASITRVDVVRDKDGNPTFDARGNPVTAEQPAYPDAKAGEMVVTKRVVEVADGDRAANEYLLNRRLGKPKQAVELSGPDGSAIPVSIEAALDKVYGEAEPPAGG